MSADEIFCMAVGLFVGAVVVGLMVFTFAVVPLEKKLTGWTCVGRDVATGKCVSQTRPLS